MSKFDSSRRIFYADYIPDLEIQLEPLFHSEIGVFVKQTVLLRTKKAVIKFFESNIELT